MKPGPLVAIHQPNFFPWLGFFDKLSRGDQLILLDDAPYPRTSTGTWTNRVAVLTQGHRHWLTAPIVRAHGTEKINDVLTSVNVRWREKIAATLRHSYARAPHFNPTWSLILPLIDNPERRLARYNIESIFTLAGALGFDASKLRIASELAIQETGTSRLIGLVQAAGGRGYLSGDGAGGYMREELFAEAGLELHFQNFRHPEYAQLGNGAFEAGLSVLDAMFNLGAARTGELIKTQSTRDI